MKVYNEKEVVMIEKVIERIICDTCEKEIEKGEYYEVTTGHNRWGNDSIESIDYFDFCSYSCMKNHMDKYFEEEGGYSSRYDIEVEVQRGEFEKLEEN